MDKKGVGGMFGTIAGTTANRKDSNFPAVAKPA
jgi:hypothetical protein